MMELGRNGRFLAEWREEDGKSRWVMSSNEGAKVSVGERAASKGRGGEEGSLGPRPQRRRQMGRDPAGRQGRMLTQL